MRLIVGVFFVLTLSSCNLIDRFFRGDVIARMGKNILYREEIMELLPKGVSPEDSAYIVDQYIDSWAKKYLLKSIAESQLSKEDRNIEREIEDFRLSLLGYRYENLYVNQRLDTLVEINEAQDYYNENNDDFITDVSVVKANFIKINANSPNLQIIRSLYRSRNLEDIDRLEDLCYSSAEVYSTYEDDWISLAVISENVGLDLGTCEKVLWQEGFIDTELSGYVYLVNFHEKVKAGELSPFEYNEETIKEIIVNKRKQSLVIGLEKNLLEEAISTNKLKIYK